MTILNDILTFFLYAVIAIAAQNAVFTRALGVSRLTRLVETGELAISKFTVLLAAVKLLSSEAEREHMHSCQRQEINKYAARDIIEYITTH